jgi:cytoskeletal protein CcmA (bactofilin family)
MFRAKEEVKESQEEEVSFNKQEEPYAYERKYEAEDLEIAPAKEVSKISAGMAINGDISAEGALELYGCVRGNISILGKMTVSGMIEGNSQAAEIYADGAKIIGEMRSDGAVKIGQETIITGNIFAASAVIAGAIKGDIDVQGPVVLDASAVVIGNIKCRSVQVNNGAVMEGMCSLC